MANLKVKNADGDTQYLGGTGTGSDGDPIVVRKEVEQATHDDLNANANIQVGNADVGVANAVPIKFGTSISLPAGTNAIGKLAANSGVDIGDVDVTSVAAGENHLGQVSGHLVLVDVTLSLDTNVYADGDVLAATQEVASALRVNDGLGLLRSVQVLDEDDQGEDFDLIFLGADVSIGTENDAVSVSDENARQIEGRVMIEAADYYDMGGCQIATKEGLGLVLEAASGDTSIYLAAVSRGTGTYTASGLRLRLGIEQY
jgi:hypothetical protein